jgi:hypothetical protein
MTESEPRPTSFGVFNPVGHVVIAMPRGADLAALRAALAEAGRAETRCLLPGEMLAQADADIANASPLAAFGQELNIVKAQRELALQGHSFVVVEASHEAQIQRVAEIARAHRATRAQHYGRWVIEELVSVGTDAQQTTETPDRGLDAQTASGAEHAPLR